MPEYVSKVSIQRGVPTVHRAGRTIDGDARAYCGITKLRRCVTVEEYRQHYALPLRACATCYPNGLRA